MPHTHNTDIAIDVGRRWIVIGRVSSKVPKLARNLVVRPESAVATTERLLLIQALHPTSAFTFL